ncbi:hypothetical protein KP509_12G023500 [Ceratopteris richardii]|uniref:Uncharacterized protein n=1 Tax=Ceratopteris richardii TaxID=49495 RepID=A0A8T2TJX4_CERRI|nr:hypothetical protein KP509_12G023500 [Ceratopteris richardii]
MKELEKGREREATLLRRAEIAEAGQEALASQLWHLEGQAHSRIREVEKASRRRVEELETKLKMSETDASTRCGALQAQAEESKAREAALLKRLQAATHAEETLASRVAGLEAEGYGFMATSRVICEDGRKPESAREVSRPEEGRLIEASREGTLRRQRDVQREENMETATLRVGEPNYEEKEPIRKFAVQRLLVKQEQQEGGKEAVVQKLPSLAQLDAWPASSLISGLA